MLDARKSKNRQTVVLFMEIFEGVTLPEKLHTHKETFHKDWIGKLLITVKKNILVPRSIPCISINATTQEDPPGLKIMA